MKVQRGALAEDVAGNDNFRVKRYIASTPSTRRSPTASRMRSARSSRQARRPGAVAARLLRREAVADPEKRHDRRRHGDPNASIPTPQPVHYRYMFGAYARAGDS